MCSRCNCLQLLHTFTTRMWLGWKWIRSSISLSNPLATVQDIARTELCVGFVYRNYNYNDAGNSLGITDLLQNPDQVAQDGNVAFQTSLWFWMTRGPHDAILRNSFSGTIRSINSNECGSQSPEVQDRVQNYKDMCSTLGVDPGNDLTCWWNKCHPSTMKPAYACEFTKTVN